MAKLAGEYEVMMNCRLCLEIRYLTTVKVRRPEGAGHLNDDGTVKKVFLGKPDGRREQEGQN